MRQPPGKAHPHPLLPRAGSPAAGSRTGRRCACHRSGCGRGAAGRRDPEQVGTALPGAPGRDPLRREFGGDGGFARRWQLVAAGRPPSGTRSAGAACPRLRGSLQPACRQLGPGGRAAGSPLSRSGGAPGAGGRRRRRDSPGLGGMGLGPPLPPPGGGGSGCSRCRRR